MFNHATYILLDAARLGSKINEAKTRNPTHDSLYRGESEHSLFGVAPYLFRYAHPTPFSNWYLKAGWGQSWGILLKSSYPLPELHKHFRKFLLVKTEDGQELYFRFYDPRVLRIFLPTCDAAQIREFFGNAIDYFICEDEDPDYALRFSHQNGMLQTERFFVKEEIAALPEPEPLPSQPEEPLPPETIAILREQGVVLPGMEPIATAAQPIPVKADLPVPQDPSKPADVSPTSSPPKTKWNTFD